ncbi:NAD(P)-dependent oxidoreductase [Candidatus Leptofilum sp.]|uniref:NAD(P)-dependent oxidoreductase n=1 Tax=Candidatus Leptofilum sp. TaxID=3241576 RepID=UPI003B59468A
MQDADCVLVSWNTPISAEVLRAAKQLKYVGMCCSLYDASSANVDIEAAQSQKITVRGVRDYGDEGVVEFIIAQLISLYKGLGKHQWGDEPTEMTGKHLGIIGFGTTGQMVAKAACSFGMQVWYYSRTRRKELESRDVRYAPLDELLVFSDVVTTHLPKKTNLLGKKEFERMKPGSILVNTSLGPTFEPIAFRDWIEQGHNYAIFDADGAGGYAEIFSSYPNVIISNKVAGWTVEARSRLTQKVIANVRDFLSE